MIVPGVSPDELRGAGAASVALGRSLRYSVACAANGTSITSVQLTAVTSWDFMTGFNNSSPSDTLSAASAVNADDVGTDTASDGAAACGDAYAAAASITTASPSPVVRRRDLQATGSVAGSAVSLQLTVSANVTALRLLLSSIPPSLESNATLYSAELASVYAIVYAAQCAEAKRIFLFLSTFVALNASSEQTSDAALSLALTPFADAVAPSPPLRMPALPTVSRSTNSSSSSSSSGGAVDVCGLSPLATGASSAVDHSAASGSAIAAVGAGTAVSIIAICIAFFVGGRVWLKRRNAAAAGVQMGTLQQQQPKRGRAAVVGKSSTTSDEAEAEIASPTALKMKMIVNPLAKQPAPGAAAAVAVAAAAAIGSDDDSKGFSIMNPLKGGDRVDAASLILQLNRPFSSASSSSSSSNSTLFSARSSTTALLTSGCDGKIGSAFPSEASGFDSSGSARLHTTGTHLLVQQHLDPAPRTPSSVRRSMSAHDYAPSALAGSGCDSGLIPPLELSTVGENASFAHSNPMLLSIRRASSRNALSPMHEDSADGRSTFMPHKRSSRRLDAPPISPVSPLVAGLRVSAAWGTLATTGENSNNNTNSSNSSGALVVSSPPYSSARGFHSPLTLPHSSSSASINALGAAAPGSSGIGSSARGGSAGTASGNASIPGSPAARPTTSSSDASLLRSPAVPPPLSLGRSAAGTREEPSSMQSNPLQQQQQRTACIEHGFTGWCDIDARNVQSVSIPSISANPLYLHRGPVVPKGASAAYSDAGSDKTAAIMPPKSSILSAFVSLFGGGHGGDLSTLIPLSSSSNGSSSSSSSDNSSGCSGSSGSSSTSLPTAVASTLPPTSSATSEAAAPTSSSDSFLILNPMIGGSSSRKRDS